MTNLKSLKSSAKSRIDNIAETSGEDELDGRGTGRFQLRDSHDTEVDDEGCLNDSETGTTFSLEECMNEFRVRRNRRNSSHGRQEPYGKTCEYNQQGITEIDTINQNLCNKEQERKCKPCKDGFCYCFSSDSGDGSLIVRDQRTSHMRPIRNRRLETVESTDAAKPRIETEEEERRKTKSTSHKSQQTCGDITAISRLETSYNDAPLIHIVQELRDNCFISKVKINKEKLQNSQKVQFNPKKCDIKQNSSVITNKKAINATPPSVQKPTAPDWKLLTDLDLPQRKSRLYLHSENSGSLKSSGHSKRRSKPAGLLLQKRLSNSKIGYKLPVINEPPLKPPRSSLSFEESSTSSTAHTSLSVREAEQVVDEFLLKRGYTLPKRSEKKMQDPSINDSMAVKTVREDLVGKKVWDPIKGNNHRYRAAYPSLKDIEKDLAKCYRSDKISSKLFESQSKESRIGFRDAKINHMLECDVAPGKKLFRSTSIQAEPQQRKETAEGVCENYIYTPPKISLDTVDGAVDHNLASNVENKKTPMKSKLPDHNSQKKNPRQRAGWSEQLRNLSPWTSAKKGEHQTKNAKSNIRVNSKAFLNKSRKKILRLISPKKENKEYINFQIRKTPFRHVASQTSGEDLRHQESPPGSYHSPVQPNPMVEQFDKSRKSEFNPNQHFDFSRQITSPTKIAIRPSQRKLNFPPNYTENVSRVRRNAAMSHHPTDVKTYRSFNEELDQDLSHTKMSYILSNIRARLESSDDFAVKTFQECQRVDGRVTHLDRLQSRRDPMSSNTWLDIEREDHSKYPIYSEIDDDSIHISESPNFDNHTGIQHFIVDNNPELIYAQVNKCSKRTTTAPQIPADPLPLGKIIHSSIMRKSANAKGTPLSPLPEPPEGETSSYSSDKSLFRPKIHCLSLNNVRSIDSNSPLKPIRNRSKSDFSLHRSEIFFDNLYKREIPKTKVENYGTSRLQKVENDQMNLSHNSTKNENEYAILSDLLHDVDEHYSVPNGSLYTDYATDGSNLQLSAIASPSHNNQSTPKKPSFTSKDLSEQAQSDMFTVAGNTTISTENVNTSSSLCDKKANELKLLNNIPLLKHMTVALRNSFRKGKQFIKTESKKLSRSLLMNEENSLAGRQKDVDLMFGSSYDIASLFTLNQSESVDEQLNKVVHICRILPDLESSIEMVEAERLLLYSKLRQDSYKRATKTEYKDMKQSPSMLVYIDDMFIPLRSDRKQDIYYNYFYIVTFESGGKVRSTQSAESQNDELIFRDCGIEFAARSEHKTLTEDQNIVRCHVFMLRLRKVSTLLLEPQQKNIREKTKWSVLSSESSSSTDTIDSRFRLHASFSLSTSNFIPYEYVQQESLNNECICIRSSKTCDISLMPLTKSTSLSSQIKLKGRVEIRFQKCSFAGFLNVEDPLIQHNWNRRWCTLHGFRFSVYDEVNCLNKFPLFYLDLQYGSNQLLYPAPRESCARPRSFCFHGVMYTTNGKIPEATMYFSAETQENLNAWLENINFALNFVKQWLKKI